MVFTKKKNSGLKKMRTLLGKKKKKNVHKCNHF